MSENTDFNNIKQWLEPLLEERGMSKEQLANDANLSRANIYFYMADKARPSEQAMIRICQVLGVPPEEGMKQYTPKKRGRPKGSKNLLSTVSVHK